MSSAGVPKARSGTVPARRSAATAARPGRRRLSPAKVPDADTVMSVVATLVGRLGPALLPTMEIVLHDLRELPNSIVAIAGNVTEREIGDPPTDVLLTHLAGGADGDLLGYPTYLPDGRRLLCSTIILRDSDGAPVGALCINNDMTHWTLLRGVADSALGADNPLEALIAGAQALERARSTVEPVAEPAAVSPRGEWFARSVGELAEHMISRCITEIGIPVALMKKEHKVRVVADLQAQGMFLIRDAVETVANSLEVSRFTIYNYLNEIGATDAPDDRRDGGRPNRSRRTEPEEGRS